MKIKNNLIEFYNDQAEKYYYTRNKHRSYGYIILDEIKKYNKKSISILEFGCGGGRLIKFLNKNIKNIKINYIGVDISDKLLDFAKKDNKENNFICQDITSYIKNTKQESLDFIIGIASFQHIPNKKERLYLMKSFYKTLKYNGILIMTNWSFSYWFIKKYTNTILESIFKSLYTFGKHNWKDLNIPRKKEINKNNIKTYKRYYHIFETKELNILGKLSGFKIKESTYIDKSGQKITNWKKSQNSLFVGKKEIFQ